MVQEYLLVINLQTHANAFALTSKSEPGIASSLGIFAAPPKKKDGSEFSLQKFVQVYLLPGYDPIKTIPIHDLQ